jgi:hypothetical protein
VAGFLFGTFFARSRFVRYPTDVDDSRHNDTRRRIPTKRRQRAERARNALDKERWLKIAEHWLMMAQETEEDER